MELIEMRGIRKDYEMGEAEVHALRGVDLCVKSLPTWDEEAGTIDMYYWYYGTLALFQVGHDLNQWLRAHRCARLHHTV